jgi:class 3 adenylate cyclase/nitrite reductase/ring-hydroxylating ferredoxin subunit
MLFSKAYPGRACRNDAPAEGMCVAYRTGAGRSGLDGAINGAFMAKITSLPDNVDFEVNDDETLLEAALRSGVTFAHACGGRAKCSTCRIWVIDGLESCSARTEAEVTLAERLGFTREVRLACQLRPEGDLSVRRLVLDETDLMICSQLDRAAATRIGEAKNVTILFSDVVDSTSISEKLSPYDLMYLLNRYFVQVGDIIERNGGSIDRFIGDGVMAIFGVDDQPDAPLHAVDTALQILEATDQMKPFFASMYDIDFDVRVGLHYGECVIGSLGSIGHERLTAIGEVPNIASRIEAANKEAGTRLLISQALHDQIEDAIEVADFVRVLLRGTRDRITLYEIGGLKPDARARLAVGDLHETMQFAGKKWIRLFEGDDLGLNEWRIIPLQDYDVVVLRGTDEYFAFNNACPHLRLPLFDRRGLADGELGNYAGTDTPRPINSTITDDRGVVCRWHCSCFDLQTGEVREWATRLQEDGTSPGWEFLGDISKNQMKLTVYPCRIHDGYLWIAPE